MCKIEHYISSFFPNSINDPYFISFYQLEISSILYISFLTGSYYRLWSSFPPLSTNETTVDIYCCVDWYIFYHASLYGGYLGISVALIEAENTSLPWSYTTILYEDCGDHCWNLWSNNYSNYLIGSQMYSNLVPNTLYTVAVLVCYPPYYSCTVGSAYFTQYSNITTRPEGMNYTCGIQTYITTCTCVCT